MLFLMKIPSPLGKKQNSDCSFNLREEKLLGPPVVAIPNIDFTKIVTEESVTQRCSIVI
jgi:hypothetical protein